MNQSRADPTGAPGAEEEGRGGAAGDGAVEDPDKPGTAEVDRGGVVQNGEVGGLVQPAVLNGVGGLRQNGVRGGAGTRAGRLADRRGERVLDLSAIASRKGPRKMKRKAGRKAQYPPGARSA